MYSGYSRLFRNNASPGSPDADGEAWSREGALRATRAVSAMVHLNVQNAHCPCTGITWYHCVYELMTWPCFAIPIFQDFKGNLKAGWWFGTFLYMFPSIGNTNPNIRGVGQPPSRSVMMVKNVKIMYLARGTYVHCLAQRDTKLGSLELTAPKSGGNGRRRLPVLSLSMQKVVLFVG